MSASQKKFVCTVNTAPTMKGDGTISAGTVLSPKGISRAAGFGWDDYDRGYRLLDNLEVGQEVVDQDGDTWKRTQ